MTECCRGQAEACNPPLLPPGSHYCRVLIFCILYATSQALVSTPERLWSLAKAFGGRCLRRDLAWPDFATQRPSSPLAAGRARSPPAMPV